MKSHLISTCLAAAAAFSTVSAEATTLAGQSVSVNTHAVDILSNVIDGPSVTVAAPGVATGFVFPLEATYADNTITVSDPSAFSSITFLTSNFLTGTPFSFNGLSFLISSPVLTGVAIDPASTVAGVGASFNADTISLALAGVTFNTGDTLILDLNGYTPSPGVPEPGAWTLMLAGFGAIGAAARRRRSVAVA